jgi:hypothetical protein
MYQKTDNNKILFDQHKYPADLPTITGYSTDGIIPVKKSKPSLSGTVSNTAPHLKFRWQSQSVSPVSGTTLRIEVHPLRESTNGYPPHGVVSQLPKAGQYQSSTQIKI